MIQITSAQRTTPAITVSKTSRLVRKTIIVAIIAECGSRVVGGIYYYVHRENRIGQTDQECGGMKMHRFLVLLLALCPPLALGQVVKTQEHSFRVVKVV